MPLTLSSPAFDNNKNIPMQFTCEGQDTAPTLTWQDAPAATKSFALILDDPDAPNGMWVHWVLFNIPATTKEISAMQTLSGAINATNSWGNIGYGGPCPPQGTSHRYFFKLYALDTTLNLTAKATKQDVLNAMQHHILETAQLIGIYKKTKN